jgi:hypothetical protein
VFQCSLRADNDPKSLGAAKPATIAYTANSGARDSYAITAALRSAVDTRIGFLSLKASVFKNNQAKARQDSRQLSVGVHWEPSNVASVFDEWVERGRTGSTDVTTVFLDLDAGYVRTGLFPDPKKDTTCTTSTPNRACGDQGLRSFRVSFAASPYLSKLDRRIGGANFILLPTVAGFRDEALNDRVVLGNGKAVTGGVVGTAAGLTLSIVPSLHAARWQLLFTPQMVWGLKRSAGRRDSFAATSRLLSVSLNYALAGAYLGQATPNTWLPSLSLSYTNGSDPLKGQAEQENVALALSIKY